MYSCLATSSFHSRKLQKQKSFFSPIRTIVTANQHSDRLSSCQDAAFPHTWEMEHGCSHYVMMKEQWILLELWGILKDSFTKGILFTMRKSLINELKKELKYILWFIKSKISQLSNQALGTGTNCISVAWFLADKLNHKPTLNGYAGSQSESVHMGWWTI